MARPRTQPTLLGALAPVTSTLNAPVVSSPGAKASPEQIGALVAKLSEGTSAEPLLLLAVIEVESGFNARAVGDGGTSFGLFQLHQGGALGSHSKEWAFNPENSIRDAVSRLAGARTGRDAANVQRPANKAAYARKVDANLAKLRKAFAAQPGAGNPNSGGKKWSPERAAVRELAKVYGLRHTSGDRAKKYTSSGNISDHWQGQTDSWADDYSNGVNTPQMRAFQQAVRARGLKQVIGPLDGPAADHMDHVHVAGYSTKGQGEGAKGGGSSVSVVKATLSGNLQRAALGYLGARAGEALDVAQGATAIASDAVQGAVLDGLKAGFRYLLILAVFVLAGVLIIAGLTRAAGEVKG